MARRLLTAGSAVLASGLASVLATGLATGLAIVPAAPAAASAPGFPGNTRSHYLTTVDAGALRAAGRTDARDAATAGIRRALVVLDAGSPAAADGSVRLPDTGATVGADRVEAATVAYGAAWARAGGPPLVLVVGTTNYGGFVGARHGAAWGRLVDAAARRLAGAAVEVRGGLDAELEFGPPGPTRAWVRGFTGATGRRLVDFGSCTCPPRAAPAGGWSREDRWAVATAGGRGDALPEIYATGGGNAREWAALVAWSKRRHPDRPVRLLGVLTEVAACTGPPVRTCAGIDVSPQTAWQQLVAAMGSGADSLRYASDIGYLSHAGAVHGPLAPVGGPAGVAGLALAVVLLAGVAAGWLLRRSRAGRIGLRRSSRRAGRRPRRRPVRRPARGRARAARRGGRS